MVLHAAHMQQSARCQLGQSWACLSEGSLEESHGRGSLHELVHDLLPPLVEVGQVCTGQILGQGWPCARSSTWQHSQGPAARAVQHAGCDLPTIGGCVASTPLLTGTVILQVLVSESKSRLLCCVDWAQPVLCKDLRCTSCLQSSRKPSLNGCQILDGKRCSLS